MKAMHLYLVSKGIYLVLAISALLMAIYNPEISIPREFRHYVFVVDISQSMNVEDMRLHEQPISRLNHSLKLLNATIRHLPCETKVSVALFSHAEIVPLYVPIEVCDNFSVIQDSLSHIEWRMAWRGSSHIRLGLLDVSRMLLSLPEPAQIIFLTDGDEAAPINAVTKVDLAPMPGSSGWLLAGVGAMTPSPVPKFNSKDQVIGYWSQYATKIEPSQIVNEDSVGKRDDSIATDPREYYLSSLQEEYLKEVSKEIGANYVRADTSEHLQDAVSKLPPTGYDRSPIKTGWIFAMIAGLLVFAEYLPCSQRIA